MEQVAVDEAGDQESAEPHLRFAPDTLVHLGERLIPHAEQGIVELAKNAYDADAERCTVSLVSHGRSIRVSDNGVGMTRAEVINGWLVLGRSSKGDKKPTDRFSRVPVGDKGLGRLAALRLGKVAILKTRPLKQPGTEHSLTINWSRYDAAQTVEEVELSVATEVTSKSPGTDIEIQELRKPLTRSDLDKLARSLVLLSSPFEANREFRVALEVPEYKDLEERVANSYLDAAQYKIDATLDSEGYATFRLLDWKGGETSRPERSERSYKTVPARFELWAFSLDKESFSTRSARLADVRAWLNVVGGVHLYEGTIRVPPYGSAGNDWLDMNLRRARSPEGRPSTNTSVGRVVVNDSQQQLIQKTDRVGYVENEAFSELKAFCVDALNWANRKVMAPIEEERRARRAEAERQSRAAREEVERAVEALPQAARTSIQVVFDKMVDEREKEVRSLKQDLQLYRSLATAGMTSAVFAHEVGKPLNILKRNLPRIEAAIVPEKKESLGGVVSLIRNAAERLTSYASLPLALLAKDKRRIGRVPIVSTVKELVELYRPIFESAKITVELNVRGEMYANGTEALLDGVLINLFANSVTAFQRPEVSPSTRTVRITITGEAEFCIIAVADNAGGIRGIEPEEAWLPGVTTTSDGTGFGLTIVRDSMSDLGGTISLIPLTEFGGAEFTIQIPTIEGALI